MLFRSVGVLPLKLVDLKKALDGADMEAIKRATEALANASQTASQKLYEAAAATASAGGGGSSGGANAPSDDDIIDAEIVDEK